MNIEYLREFVDLSETLSFTATSKRFYITQPVLSKHISRIESEMGVELFIRGKNGVHLTESGRLFAQSCIKMLTILDETKDSIEYLKMGNDRPIDLGYLYGASSCILPGALKEFSKSKHNNQVRYVSLEIDEIPKALDENAIDIAITSDLEKFDSERFVWMDLYPDALCLVVPNDHRLADRDVVTIDDLVGESLVLPRSTFMPQQSAFITQLLSPIADTIKPKKVIGDLNSVAMSMKIERCGAIEFAHLENYLNFDEFSFIPLVSSVPRFSVVAVWKRSKQMESLIDLSGCLKNQCRKKQLPERFLRFVAFAE